MKLDEVMCELLRGGHIEVVSDRIQPSRVPDKRFLITKDRRRVRLPEKVFYALRRREFIVLAGSSPMGRNIELFKLNAKDLFDYR